MLRVEKEIRVMRFITDQTSIFVRMMTDGELDVILEQIEVRKIARENSSKSEGG